MNLDMVSRYCDADTALAYDDCFVQTSSDTWDEVLSSRPDDSAQLAVREDRESASDSEALEDGEASDCNEDDGQGANVASVFRAIVIGGCFAAVHIIRERRANARRDRQARVQAQRKLARNKCLATKSVSFASCTESQDEADLPAYGQDAITTPTKKEAPHCAYDSSSEDSSSTVSSGEDAVAPVRASGPEHPALRGHPGDCSSDEQAAGETTRQSKTDGLECDVKDSTVQCERASDEDADSAPNSGEDDESDVRHHGRPSEDQSERQSVHDDAEENEQTDDGHGKPHDGREDDQPVAPQDARPHPGSSGLTTMGSGFKYLSVTPKDEMSRMSSLLTHVADPGHDEEIPPVLDTAALALSPSIRGRNMESLGFESGDSGAPDIGSMSRIGLDTLRYHHDL